MKRKFLIHIAMDWDAMETIMSEVGQAASYETCRARMDSNEKEGGFLAQVGQFFLGANDADRMQRLNNDLGQLIACVQAETIKVISKFGVR